MAKYSGWSYYGRPFSQTQFKNSELAKTMSYSGYLTSYAKQWKSPKLRRSL